MQILNNISLKNYNTFGIDARSAYFTEIFSENDLEDLFVNSVFKENKRIVLGGGSNILFSGDFKGLVIRNNLSGIGLSDFDNERIELAAGAGVIWNDLVKYTIKKNLGGIENLSLIPGTVGAAPMQNIGAYGQEVRNVFHKLEGYFIPEGKKKIFKFEECKFGYRDSIFKRDLKDKFIITKVSLLLNKNPEVDVSYGSVKNEIDKLGKKDITIKDVSEIICKIRKEKLPDPSVIGNAGSFFKNPVITFDELEKIKREYRDVVYFPADDNKVKVAAGWLIEKCGWKGKRIGETGTHQNQSLVLVNYGKATGAEILSVAENIKNSVKEKFGVALHEEVNIY